MSHTGSVKTSRESRKAALRISHLLSRCQVVLLKYVTITNVPTATVATVTITTVSNITTVIVTTVTIATVTIN